MMHCSNCGGQIQPGETFCGFCGAPVGAVPSRAGSVPEAGKSPMEAEQEDVTVFPAARRQRQSGLGLTTLICILALLALFCAAACYLLLTRGPDPSAWFAPAAALSPSPSPSSTAVAQPGSSVPGLPGLLPGSSAAPEGAAGEGGAFPGLLFSPTPVFAPSSPTAGGASTAAPSAAPAQTPAATPTPTPTAKPTATPRATKRPAAASPTPTPMDDVAHAFLDALIVEGLGRYYTEDELRDKTAAELSILRNGMYALSGLEFKKNTTLREFFGRCDWYAPNTTNAETVYARFNEFQKGNVAAIVAVEKSEGYRLENTSLQKLVQEGRERYFTEAELENKTAFELSILRNGMYALSGLRFVKNESLREFFENCDWYAPDTTDAETVYARFNKYQKGNVAAIVKIEKAKGYR